MQTYLWKAPTAKPAGFQKKFFILSGSRLQFFDDEKSAIVKGEWNFESSGSVKEVAESSKQSSFCVRFSKEEEESYFAAANADQMRQWIEAMRTAISGSGSAKDTPSLIRQASTNLDTVFFQGMEDKLWLQGAKKFEQKSVVLKDGTLTIGKDAIPIGADFVIGEDAQASRPYSFFVSAGPSGEKFVLSCSSEQAQLKWVQMLMKARDNVRKSSELKGAASESYSVLTKVNKMGFLVYKKKNFWWVLNDTALQQFNKQGDTSCKLELPVKGGSVAKDNDSDLSFLLTTIGGKGSNSHIFQAPNAIELAAWIEALKRVQQGATTGGPRIIGHLADQLSLSEGGDGSGRGPPPSPGGRGAPPAARGSAAASPGRAPPPKAGERAPPPRAGGGPTLRPAGSAARTKKAAPTKPDDCVWQPVWEEEYQMYYYVNVETSASSWEKPPEIEEYEAALAKYEEDLAAYQAEPEEDAAAEPAAQSRPVNHLGAPAAGSNNRSRRVSVMTFDDTDVSVMKTMKVSEVKSTAPAPPTHDQQTLSANSFSSLTRSGLLETEKKSLIGRKEISENDLTQWSKSIAQPLMKSMNESSEDVKKGLQVFKNILSFMGDRKSSKAGAGHVVKLVCNALDASDPEDGLRDEILCQIMRQTNKNPDKTSLTKGFTLMEMCLGIFPPSPRFHLFLSCYLQTASSHSHSPESSARLAACREILEKVMQNGPRRFPPTEEEIASVITQKHIAVCVLLLDGSQHYFTTRSQTPVADIVYHIMTQFGLDLPFYQTTPCFGLIQQIWQDGRWHTDTPLTPNARLLDVVSSWAQMETNFEGDIEFKLVFTPRLFFYTLLKEDVVSKTGLRHYFLQAVQDILRGIYPVPVEEALNLAALQIQVEFPNKDPSNTIFDKMNLYVPESVLTSQQDVAAALGDQRLAALKLLGRILTVRSTNYKSRSPGECMRLYLDMVQKLPHYGAAVFQGILTADCKVCDWDFEEGELSASKSAVNKLKQDLEWSIGISERGVLLIDVGDNRALKKHIQLKTVSSFGTSFEPQPMFWFITGDPKQPPTSDQSARVLVFKTAQGKSMSEMMKMYQTLPHNQCPW